MLVFFSFLVSISSCTLGPRYTPPTVEIAKKWPLDSMKVPLSPVHLASHVKWWEQFKDPILNNLIEKALRSNLDIQDSINHIDQAAVHYSAQVWKNLPNAGLTAFALDSQASDVKLNPGIANIPLSNNGTVTSVAFDLSWEIDLFGKIRQQRNEAKAALAATMDDHDSVLLSVVSYITKYYIELRSLQAKKEILLENIQHGKKILKLVEMRYHGGLDNYSLVAQQKISLHQEHAELVLLQARIDGLIGSLELVSGQNMGTLITLLQPPKPIPLLQKKISLDAPAAVLVRRPDVGAAERDLAAANARIGQAMANLMPSLSIGALLGWQNISLFNVISSKGSLVQPTAIMLFPFLNFTNIQMVKLRKVEYIGHAIHYQKTVMSALNEIAEYYGNYCHQYTNLQDYKKALDEKRIELQLNQDLYRSGVKEYVYVLQDKKQYNQLKLQHIQSKEAFAIAVIQLYKALGGGIESC